MGRMASHDAGKEVGTMLIIVNSLINRLKNTLIYNNINSRPKEAKSMNLKRQRQRGAHKNKHDKSVWSLGLYVEVSLTII